jgi:hypothetical protein
MKDKIICQFESLKGNVKLYTATNGIIKEFSAKEYEDFDNKSYDEKINILINAGGCGILEQRS